MATQTSNPAGSPKITDITPAPTAPSAPSAPGPDVANKQDPSHTEAEFVSDLEKATRRVAE
ncbi:MAG: hypothetical protein QOD71_1735 [Thermoleophilaceae bacterium]|jgi:hypothetical protein|nr:hypothetical protein [Thermoleophilaceae bacterium]